MPKRTLTDRVRDAWLAEKSASHFVTPVEWICKRLARENPQININYRTVQSIISRLNRQER